jgi:hypothetical protein
VVFTGDPDKEKGGFYLINSDGRQTRVFHENNYLDDESQFVDVNGDGLPEIVHCAALGGKAEDNPNKVVIDATSVDIIPISSEQVPLLRLVFDVRPFRAKPSWQWRLEENSTGTRDVVVEQQSLDGWMERAKFVWSADKSRFEGPEGSKADGFIARSGDIEPEQIRQFMRLPQSAKSTGAN